jgi:hypothetical protein
MRKIAYIVLGVSTGITVLSVILWVLGFAFAAAAVGNLIHLLLVLAMVASLGIGIGVILLIVSYVRK